MIDFMEFSSKIKMQADIFPKINCIVRADILNIMESVGNVQKDANFVKQNIIVFNVRVNMH